MSFPDQQTSEYGGKPILLFEFTDMVRYWRYTDQANVITKDGEDYTPAIITLDGLSQNLAEGAQGFNIRVSSDADIAMEFKPYLPARPIFLRVITRHLSDESDEWIVPCVGEVASASFDTDGMANLLVSPALYKARRVIPWPMYSTTCNWGLYSPGCTVDKDDFRVDGNVDAIDLLDLTVSELATKPDGWFTAGYVVRVSTGERRWIVAHTGAVVTMAAPLLGLAVAEAMEFYAGCDGFEQTCKDKFDNLPRFFGFPDIPKRNPFIDNVFGTGNPAAGASTKKDKPKARWH